MFVHLIHLKIISINIYLKLITINHFHEQLKFIYIIYIKILVKDIKCNTDFKKFLTLSQYYEYNVSNNIGLIQNR